MAKIKKTAYIKKCLMDGLTTLADANDYIKVNVLGIRCDDNNDCWYLIESTPNGKKYQVPVNNLFFDKFQND